MADPVTVGSMSPGALWVMILAGSFLGSIQAILLHAWVDARRKLAEVPRG